MSPPPSRSRCRATTSPLRRKRPSRSQRRHVGPTDDVHYTADELDQSLTDARDAAAALSAADKDAVKKAKAQYYRKLYQLAETTTFVAPEAGAAPDTAKVRELLDEVAADPASFGEIGKAAGKWIAIAKGKEHQGVVLAGAVQSVAKQGQVYETKVLLSDGTQAVSVLGAHKPTFASGDQVIVVGSIVSDPAHTIEGYEGTEATAVWCGLAIKAPSGG